jgi:hypothetical protein
VPTAWREFTFVRLVLLAVAVSSLSLLADDDWRTTSREDVRFSTIEIFLDSGSRAFAAWQLELRATKGMVKIVGIEGGEHPEFKDPPRHDPKAIQRERVKLAAFSTAAADRLPKGRTRVATVHVQIRGKAEPEWQVKVQAAADAGGRTIPVEASVKNKEPK